MGEAGQAERLSNAAGGPSADRLAARFSLKRLALDESGATAVEYGLIVACIFLAIIGGLSAFASNENAMYARIGTAMGSALR